VAPSPVTAPERSLKQRMSALERANEIRSKRATLKRNLKAERVDVVAMLKDPPDWLCTMHVVDILMALPKVGRVKANKYLNRCRMSPHKTVAGMSDRQRHELIAAMM
jgi:hypothetical protein